MKTRRLSRDPLPRSPLDFAYPLTIRAPGVEGAAILVEVQPEYAATVLRALRLVLAWSRGPELAAAMLRPGPMDEWEAELHAARFRKGLWAPLVTIAAELRRPGRAQPDAVAEACFAVSEWALGVDAEGTALLFAEAAALAWPTNARHAWIVGRMLRNAGRLREGELWLRRSARLAVWSADAETQDLALNSLGNLYLQQGLFAEALEYLGRALALARRCRLKDREGAVSHDLFQVFVVTGNHSRAEELAVCAFDLYGPGHPNLPKLAHDVAYLWLEQKRFPLALPVLRALLPHLPRPHERLRVIASIARAAGACGERVVYEGARKEALALLQEPTAEMRGFLSGALIDLGYGAASMGDWDGAAEALRLALKAAHERGAHDDAAEAETALNMALRFQGVETPRRPASGPAAQLSDALAKVLETASAGGPAGDGTT